MLTKGQKIYMYISAIIAMVIGIIAFVPFRTLPFLCDVNNVHQIVEMEFIIKLIILPVVVIALSVYANIKKYQEIEDGLDRSKVVNVMSYFPIVSYLIGILTYTIHTLAYSTLIKTASYAFEPLGFGLWALIITILVLYVVFMVFGFILFPNQIIKLENVGTVIFDCALVLTTFCFILVAWRVSSAYLDVFALTMKSETVFSSFAGGGDPYLFFLLVTALIVFVILCKVFFKLVKKDNRSVYVSPEMFEKNYELIVKREYIRAYNDILDDFELYFEDHFDEPWDDQDQGVEKVEEEAEEAEEKAEEAEEKTEEVTEAEVVEITEETADELIEKVIDEITEDEESNVAK